MRACASWPAARSREGRGESRKPDSVKFGGERFHARRRTPMIIFLGCQLPGASSDLPGSRNGPGRSVNGRRNGPRRFDPPDLAQPSRAASLFGLAPDGVCRARLVTQPAGELLPRRFTLTAAGVPRHAGRGGLFSVALSLFEPREARPNGGCYPPSRPVESGLSSAACLRTQPPKPVSQPWSLNPNAPAIITPATHLNLIIRTRHQTDNLRFATGHGTNGAGMYHNSSESHFRGRIRAQLRPQGESPPKNTENIAEKAAENDGKWRFFDGPGRQFAVLPNEFARMQHTGLPELTTTHSG
jgi:hypothetical protein